MRLLLMPIGLKEEKKSHQKVALIDLFLELEFVRIVLRFESMLYFSSSNFS